MFKEGFLLIDKPIGPTSHDVVAEVRRLLYSKNLKGTKVGHAGTLDPLASGLLILGIGGATKKLGLLLGLSKCYTATVELGATTATDDSEAPPQPREVTRQPSREEVERMLKTFVGQQEQTPPVFSAKKQQGVRLYTLARAGKKVDPKKHFITIRELTATSYTYPQLDIEVTSSSGTYIRSLARDIGEALETGGYIRTLRRTAIGPFLVKDSTTLDQLTFELLSARIIPVEAVLQKLSEPAQEPKLP